MKNSEVTKLSAEQLTTEIAAEQDRLLKLKFAHAVTPLENPLRIREARRTVARLLTELKSK